jgi:hypothetical protein
LVRIQSGVAFRCRADIGLDQARSLALQDREGKSPKIWQML